MRLLSSRNRVLLPLALPEPELPDAMVDLLGGVDVLLLGWFETPEQTPPEQARDEAEDTGAEALEEQAERLREAGAEVDTRHVFTPDLVSTVQRIGAEEACDAALLARPVATVNRILVLLREDVSPEAVSSLLSDLAQDRERRTTLLLVLPEDAEEDGDERMGAMRRALEDQGLDPDHLEYRLESAADPSEKALEVCDGGEHDLVVVPEKGELEDQMFGSFAGEVASHADLPVLVLRVPGAHHD